MKHKTAVAFVLLALSCSGCQRNSRSSAIQTAESSTPSANDAIRTAIQAHLAHNGNLNLNSFDTEVKQITIVGNHADAQVEFRVKNGTGVMQLSYALEKSNGAWAVVESKPGMNNFSHPSLDQKQSSSAGANSDSSVFQVLDKMHNRTANAPKTLPPGHPPISPAPNN